MLGPGIDLMSWLPRLAFLNSRLFFLQVDYPCHFTNPLSDNIPMPYMPDISMIIQFPSTFVGLPLPKSISNMAAISLSAATSLAASIAPFPTINIFPYKIESLSLLVNQDHHEGYWSIRIIMRVLSRVLKFLLLWIWPIYFFVDDVLLFGVGIVEEWHHFKILLDLFYSARGSSIWDSTWNLWAIIQMIGAGY